MKLTVGLLTDGEPDLMWKMLDHLCVSTAELVGVLQEHAERLDNMAGES